MAALPPSGGNFLGGLEKLLSNPILQSAVAGYLGYAGSPRRGGRGLAMENAGLGALGAFNQAEAQRSKAPLEAAQLQAEQAKIPELQAQTEAEKQHGQLYAAQTASLAPDPVMDQQLAHVFQIRAQDPSLTPQQKAVYDFLTPVVAAGKIKPQDALRMAESGDVAAARIAQSQATTARETAEQGLIPERKRLLEAQTRKAERPEKAAEGPASYKTDEGVFVRDPSAPNGYRKVGTETPKGKAVSDLDLEKQADKEFEEAWKTHWHLGGFVGEDHDTAKAAFIKDWMAKHGSGASAATTFTPPPGYYEHPLDPGFKEGPRTPDGHRTAIDASGKPQILVP